MSYTANFSEQWECLVCDYIAASAQENNTGYVWVGGMHRVAIIVHPVSMGGSADVDIEQGTNSSGASAKSVDSASHDITVAQADTKPSVIELQMEELDVDGGFDYINVECTPAGSSYMVVEIWGLPRYLPASTTNLDSVTN